MGVNLSVLQARKSLTEILLKSVLDVPFEIDIRYKTLDIHIFTKTPINVYDRDDYFEIHPKWEDRRRDYYPPGYAVGTVCDPCKLYWFSPIPNKCFLLKIDYNEQTRDVALLQVIEEVKRLSVILNK